MNEDIERLKLTIYRLIGENNGLRFVVGLRRRTMNCVAVNCIVAMSLVIIARRRIVDV